MDRDCYLVAFGGQRKSLQLYCARVNSCVVCTPLNVPYNIAQLVALWYPLVLLKISAPLIPMCPLSLRQQTENNFFCLSSFISVFGCCCCCFIVWCCVNTAEQSRVNEREGETPPRPTLIFCESFMHTTFWPVYIALWRYDRNFFFFHRCLLCFPLFLFGVYFLRDKHETWNHRKMLSKSSNERKNTERKTR